MRAFLVAAWCGAIVSCGFAMAQGELVKNPGFEQEAPDGGIASWPQPGGNGVALGAGTHGRGV